MIKLLENDRERENIRQMLGLKPRTKHLGIIQFVYMNYTISTHTVIMPTKASEYKL